MEEYPLVEEKLVGGIPAPNENPLVEELLDDGTVMHADIAIAPRLHNIIAAFRAIWVMRSIIFPRHNFANRRKSAPAARRLARTWMAAAHRASLDAAGRVKRWTRFSI